MRVAITGASGFVGNRLVEKFYLEKLHEVTAVVRGTWGLAMPARFDLDWKVCDLFDVKELSRAFAGCDAVVHAALGAPYKEMAKAVYSAANKAGVRRVVILSSASIYNQNPQPGISESSPLPDKPRFRYNSDKIAADRAVRKLRARGQTEVVFLMPSIVYGPRSRWIANLATEVIEGTAYLVRGGHGVCNAVYIDNLIEAVRLSLSEPNVDGEAFFISDAETVTWLDFYRPIVSELGLDVEELPVIEDLPVFPNVPIKDRLREHVLIKTESRKVQKLKPIVPSFLKKVYKLVIPTRPSGRVATNPWEPLEPRKIEVSLEISELQQCNYKLPNTKAEQLLNFVPPVQFEEGMRRSIAWLEFAGFPIVSRKNKGPASDRPASGTSSLPSAAGQLPRRESSLASVVETKDAR